LAGFLHCAWARGKREKNRKKLSIKKKDNNKPDQGNKEQTKMSTILLLNE